MKPQNQNTPNNDSPFGEVIYAYTRAQAIADWAPAAPAPPPAGR